MKSPFQSARESWEFASICSICCMLFLLFVSAPTLLVLWHNNGFPNSYKVKLVNSSAIFDVSINHTNNPQAIPCDANLQQTCYQGFIDLFHNISCTLTLYNNNQTVLQEELDRWSLNKTVQAYYAQETNNTWQCSLTPIQQYQPISDFSHPLFIAGLFAALLIGIIAIFRVLAHIYMFCCGQTDKRICLCGIAHTLFCYACSFAIHDLMCGQKSLCC